MITARVHADLLAYPSHGSRRWETNGTLTIHGNEHRWFRLGAGHPVRQLLRYTCLLDFFGAIGEEPPFQFAVRADDCVTKAINARQVLATIARRDTSATDACRHRHLGADRRGTYLRTMARIRLLLLIEAVAFLLASMIHFGMLVDGYEHDRARIAEFIIAAVLLGGLVTSVARPDWTRMVGLGVQEVALLGTFVGLFTIAIGVGPRTGPDVIYHLGITAVLTWGLAVARDTAQ